MSAVPLIAGRDCGECQICCIVPNIDTPEIQKVSASRCRNCGTVGCTIYDTRPQVCRAFHCGWQRTADIPADWRPDISGVMVELELNSLPQFHPTAFRLVLVGDLLQTVRRPDFIDFVINNIRNHVALYLTLPGPRGMQASRLSLNPFLLQAISRSRAEVGTALEAALDLLQKNPTMPNIIRHSGNDFSG